MMPEGLLGIEAMLPVWLLAAVRPGAAMLAAPAIGMRGFPVQLRIILALGIAVATSARVAPTMPVEGLASLSGLLLIAGEALAGLALGFTLQLGYAASLIAGEVIAGAMGLSFAGTGDAAGAGQVPVLSSLFSVIAMLLFFAGDGHLLLISASAGSLDSLPPGAVPAAEVGQAVAGFAGHMFAAGLAVALPVGTASLLVQVAMAMLARSAPQLGLFAVGLPAALLAGLLFLALGAPLIAEGIGGALDGAFDQLGLLAGEG